MCCNGKYNSRRAPAAAFSLVEVLMAIVIMATIFAAVFASISSSFQLLQNARENLRATQVLVSRMEGLRLMAWGSDELFNTNIVPPTFTDSFYPLDTNGTATNMTYYGTMTIVTNPVFSPPASYSPNMALVKVTVTWTNGAYGAVNVHTRSMITYVSQFGMQNYIYNPN